MVLEVFDRPLIGFCIEPLIGYKYLTRQKILRKMSVPFDQNMSINLATRAI
jgi:hypothetical protein